MIKVEHIDVYGWEAAIRGMRNAMNSWDKSDSEFYYDTVTDENDKWRYALINIIGDNDLALMKKLCKAGTDHRKFMRMITVSMDIIAPLYWWKQWSTYKVGTVTNSCSTMHKIHDKEFTIDDFSHEHLGELYVEDGGKWCEDYPFTYNLLGTIEDLNLARKMYIKTKNKDYWYTMIHLLPSSYNQRRTVLLNYEVLRNMYHSRKSHKLDEWRDFCKEIEKLPYSELITGVD